MDKVIELAKQAGFAHCEHYSGGWMATMERFYTLARADLEAEIFRLREHIIDQTKLEAENAKLCEALENCMNILEVEVFRGLAYQAPSAALGEK